MINFLTALITGISKLVEAVRTYRFKHEQQAIKDNPAGWIDNHFNRLPSEEASRKAKSSEHSNSE